jgi:integrase
VLLATFATRRWGELIGLRRRDVDIRARTVRVARSGIQADSGAVVDGDPKTWASFRTVAFPARVGRDLADHLARFVGEDLDALLFVGERGGRLRRGNFHRIWTRRARASVCRNCTCMTSGIPATRSPRRAVRRCLP